MELEQILEERNLIHERLKKVPYVFEKDKYEVAHVKAYMNQVWEVSQGIKDLKELCLRVLEFFRNQKTKDLEVYNSLVKKCSTVLLSILWKNLATEDDFDRMSGLDHSQHTVLGVVCRLLLNWVEKNDWDFLAVRHIEDNDGDCFFRLYVDIFDEEDWEAYIAEFGTPPQDGS